MRHVILGLHHVTATVGDAQPDLAFCIDLLGLRLVKKTVNFDDHHVYHFYYGDERGTPGTIWTTFPYKGRGVHVGARGAGQLVATSFSVPESSLDWWHDRLNARDAVRGTRGTRFGEELLSLTDPSGLHFEVIATSQDPRTPWTGRGFTAATAIRGLHSVTMLVRDAAPSLDLLTGVLGFQVVAQDGPRTRVAVAGHAPGDFIDVVEDRHAPDAVNGLGTVHHVAMAIATPVEQLEVREDLLTRGLHVTEVRDRCYFQSIYFREPGGVLFEVATIRPGFTVDEDLASLGRGLKLPPWEEPFRPEIEEGLTVVNLPQGNLAQAGPHADQPVVESGAPLGTGQAVVIMVHGRNAAPANILDLARRWNRPALTYLAPAAAGRTWYPHSFMADIASNEPGISSGIARLASLVERVESAGVARSQIVLCGFSQGACLASEFAIRHAGRFGGLLMFSGGAIGPPGTTWPYEGRFEGTPVFIGCSDRDDHIPETRVRETSDIFVRMGADVTLRVYPGMGHLVNDDEIAFAQGLLDTVAGQAHA
jgi:glyoxalase family protein